MNVSVNKR